MKKILMLTITAFAMANAVFAQTEAKDSIKAAVKAKKAQDASDLKAFKAKQKEELAAFIEAQKSGKPVQTIEKPAMQNSADSLAYIFGVMQSRGLQEYALQQFNVDEQLLPKFAEGILSRVKIDPNDKEQSAYQAGNQVGGQILSMTQSFSKDYYAADEGMNIDPSIVASGLVAALLGQEKMPTDSANKIFQEKMTARQAANKEKLYGSNREAGEKFLEENKNKPGVVTTASGLQYKVITQGTGEKPTKTQKAKVNYEGKLIDGTVFDSSYERGEPVSFGVNQVISGWTEALLMMPVGSKWELYIPYQLAYGDRDTGGEIKPYSALIFTVELLGIE